jgi:MFS family permease
LSGGYVADRFGPRISTAFVTLVPAGLIIALLGWVEINGVLLVAALALSGYLIGLLIPSRDLLLRSVTPPGSMGKVMGFASTGSNLGGALIPVVLGYAMDTAGGHWVFWICALFIGAAFLTFITARTKYGT